VDCHMFLDVMQSKLKLDCTMNCTSIIDGNEIWLAIYELVFSTYCTLCEISTFLDGLNLMCQFIQCCGHVVNVVN
jgi:hypothetical protein